MQTNRIVKHGVQNNTAMTNPKTNHFDGDCFRIIMAFYFLQNYFMAFICTFTQTSATTFYFTVTLILTFLLPDFTVIVTFPDFFAFTTPFEETVTTFLLEEV